MVTKKFVLSAKSHSQRCSWQMNPDVFVRDCGSELIAQTRPSRADRLHNHNIYEVFTQ